MDKAKVLIVEGEDGVRRLLADGLTERGFHVASAGDGAAALAQLREADFDVVVLDLQTSPVGGWEVVERLRAQGSETAVLLLVAHIDVTIAVSALRAGVFDVLQKPVRLAELTGRIDDVMREKAKGQRAGPADEPQAKSSTRIKIARPANKPRQGVERLLGESKGIRRIREQIISLSRFRDVSALIIGETGTGKEVVAAAIHDLSAADSPFVSINCAAIPEELFESELFGHEPGAFTGARGARPGLLETVGDGTLFLDEVGEMPARLQPKFLRVLQTRLFRRIGGKQERSLRARVVSATNRKLTAEEQEGIRPDLYFRLAGFTISLPPLRKRMSDVDALAHCFLREFADRYPGLPTRFDDSAAEVLLSYGWPGNIRELRTVMEQAAMLARTNIVDKEAVLAALQQGQAHLDEYPSERPAAPDVSPFGLDDDLDLTGIREIVPPASSSTLRRRIAGQDGGTALNGPVDLNEIQRQITIEVFEQLEGNLARTARHLRIPRTTLRDRLRRYGVL